MRHLRLLVALSLAAAALSTIPFAAGQQPTGDPFSTEIRKVKDGLYVIPGYDGAVTGGNVAVRVTSEGTIIVDDRLPPSSAEIAGKVRSVTSQPIKYVLSTHGHGDHTGGHPEFITVAEIVAHRNNRANMIRSKLAAPPRLVFTDQAAVFLGNVEAQAIHLGRGHTNGDAVIYFPDLRTIHTGDLVVWGKRTDGSVLTPFVDRASGGSLVAWITTLDGVLKLDFDTAIPGHGPVLTKDHIRTFHRNLVTLRQRLTEVVKAGAKKEELGARLKTDDLGWPFPPERLNELWDEFGAGR
ncbi:MAG TPA: MBL fold metallo-hydrolase [Vicinamibacterales bacterium]|nr:MBL fold metallo-hydrolase [Vicinamibacterales bacterium]